MKFKVKFQELNHKDELTGNTIIEFSVEGNRNKIHAIDQAVKRFKTEHRDLYLDNRHNYYIEAIEV